MGMKTTDAMQRVASVFYGDWYSKTEAAKILGIDRKTLREKLKNLLSSEFIQ